MKWSFKKGIIEVEHQPLVSVDFNTNSNSAIIDAKSTMVMSGKKRVIAWYDNEWGYSNRVVDVAEDNWSTFEIFKRNCKCKLIQLIYSLTILT